MAKKKVIPLKRIKKRIDAVPALRNDEESRALRRTEVFELHFMQGLERNAIAELLGVSTATIGKDIKLLRQELAREMRGADVVEEVALAAAKYEKVAQLALYELSQARTEVGKSKLLGQALRAMEGKNQFLMSTGVLPSRRSQIDLRVHGMLNDEEYAGVSQFHSLLNDPERRRGAVSFVERLLAAGDTIAELPVDTPEVDHGRNGNGNGSSTTTAITRSYPDPAG